MVGKANSEGKVGDDYFTLIWLTFFMEAQSWIFFFFFFFFFFLFWIFCCLPFQRSIGNPSPQNWLRAIWRHINWELKLLKENGRLVHFDKLLNLILPCLIRPTNHTTESLLSDIKSSQQRNHSNTPLTRGSLQKAWEENGYSCSFPPSTFLSKYLSFFLFFYLFFLSFFKFLSSFDWKLDRVNHFSPSCSAPKGKNAKS